MNYKKIGLNAITKLPIKPKLQSFQLGFCQAIVSFCRFKGECVISYIQGNDAITYNLDYEL
jgi:hypothetical protein